MMLSKRVIKEKKIDPCFARTDASACHLCGGGRRLEGEMIEMWHDVANACYELRWDNSSFRAAESRLAGHAHPWRIAGLGGVRGAFRRSLA
jgi:hypothetical protein